METNILFSVFIFLMAACLIVPLAGRLKLGSVLGYLVAGVLIGPFGAGLIENPESIMHFAEFGVVMMLFIIGLELEPEKLWALRKSILGLGGMQLVLTTAAITSLGMALGYEFASSLAAGMALSLSSTALVLQVLQEKSLFNTSAGESSFAVLLFQDIAVIPILAIMPILAGGSAPLPGVEASVISSMPAWLHAELVLGVIIAIVFGGRYASRSVFRYMANTNLREIFTATSLALIVGITLLMELIGLSPAMGAFVAGVVLASSEYKHTLETDIEPFKNLLLGLFFISVGMGMNFNIFAANMAGIISCVVALVVIKSAILMICAKLFRLDTPQSTLFSLLMSQGGEFAFVLLQYTGSLHILPQKQSDFLVLVVTLSMITTPFLMMFSGRYVMPRFMSQLPERSADNITENNSVIIAGYGRFGQIIGRFLRAQGINPTILEKSPEQIDLLRKFGSRGYFGDASRMDLLASAGAAKAKLLVVAVDDADKALEIVREARENFPNLTIYARARNRRHAYELNRAGAHLFIRETFDASLRMAQEVMVALGYNAQDMYTKAQKFMEHDEATLKKSFEFFEQEPELISFSRSASQELERILQNDSQS